MEGGFIDSDLKENDHYDIGCRKIGKISDSKIPFKVTDSNISSSSSGKKSDITSKKKKRSYLNKLTPKQLKESSMMNQRRNENMPFSPIIPSKESSNSTIKISCVQSEGSSNIKFSYSQTKGAEGNATPRFTDSATPMKKMWNTSDFQTPKCEPAVLASVNPSSSKSQLNNEYFQVSRRLTSGKKSKFCQTPMLRPAATPHVSKTSSESNTVSESNSVTQVGLIPSQVTNSYDRPLTSSESISKGTKNIAVVLFDSANKNENEYPKGGGGTGLMYGTSDKSSSSDKKLKNKGSASSNSSGIKDLHAGINSGNSSSDKSEKRNLEILAQRNNIRLQDFYKYGNSEDSKSNLERTDNSDLKRAENSHICGPSQFQDLDEGDYDSTPEVYIKMNSTPYTLSYSKSASKREQKLMESGESQYVKSSKKPDSPNIQDSITNFHNSEDKFIKKTPEKIPYDQISKSEDGKDNGEGDMTSKCPSSNITPFKSLETIKEEETYLEIENTQDQKCERTPQNFEEVKFKSPSLANCSSNSPFHASFGNSMAKFSTIKKSEVGFTPQKRNHNKSDSFNIFTPSPNSEMKKKATPVKIFKNITSNESGTTKRFMGKEVKSEIHSSACGQLTCINSKFEHLLIRSKSCERTTFKTQKLPLNFTHDKEKEDIAAKDRMYMTQRGQSNKRLQDLRQVVIASSEPTIEEKKEFTSTQPESKHFYTTTESVGSQSNKFETKNISEKDLEKFVKPRTLRSSLTSQRSKKLQSPSESPNEVKFKDPPVHSSADQKSGDKILKKSLLQQYKKSNSKSTTNIKKLYSEYLKQKDGHISVNQIKPPSTLDLRTPKESQDNKRHFEIQTEPVYIIHPQNKRLVQMRSAKKLNFYSRGEENRPVNTAKGPISSKNIDKMWNKFKKRKSLLSTNQNHLRNSRNNLHSPQKRKSSKNNQVYEKIRAILNQNHITDMNDSILDQKISIKELILLLLDHVESQK
ncbi:unnamed protein product [Moneuplotes crassus]|uniref:Uncharacterized protein n=1 Tax=Euplotes crassus TaxID=5936 RepID=A0AAD1XNP3_EUPCR|nr:unnamed protein product [Moneuplotes crassus]